MLRQVKLYASISKLVNVHPLEKIIFCLISLIICSSIENKVVILINIIFFLCLIVKNKLPYNLVFKFFIIAVTFTLISSITLVLNRSFEIIPLLLLRTINGAVSISFLALTTPLNHIVYLLSKNSFTNEIGEIANSMETFLILVEDDFNLVMRAMKTRGAFNRKKESITSMGKAIGTVFKNLMRRWSEINDGLKNRGYKGKHYYSADFIISKKNMFLLFLYAIVLLIVVL